MSEKNLTSIDDFYVTTNSADSIKELVDSYTEFENELAKLPKQQEPLNEVTKLNFFKEVHANRKGERLYRKRDDASSSLNSTCFKSSNHF